jgi:uncharacterized glyoxalase superfamily protein PhnB
MTSTTTPTRSPAASTLVSGRYTRRRRRALEAPNGQPIGRCPKVSIEFDVPDAAAVDAAAQELEQAGYELLHPAREEPWGQTVARLQSLEGAIVGISYAPSLHD